MKGGGVACHTFFFEGGRSKISLVPLRLFKCNKMSTVETIKP